MNIEWILFQLVQFKNAMIQQYMKKKVRLKGKKRVFWISFFFCFVFFFKKKKVKPFCIIIIGSVIHIYNEESEGYMVDKPGICKDLH